MPRTLLRIALLIAAGLLTSVAVAWGATIAWTNSSWIVFTPMKRLILTPDADEQWLVSDGWVLGTRSVTIVWIEDPLSAQPPVPDDLEVIGSAEIPGWVVRDRPTVGIPPREVTSFAAGWPFTSLTAFHEGNFLPTRLSMSTSRPRHNYWVVRGPTTDYPLPIKPHFPGLLADTTLWAAAWWLLLLIPRTAARFRRARHGWCLMCGYDLHGVYRAGCPECGWLKTASHDSMAR